MISASEGRYDMLLLQPVGPSLHMTTYIQETGEPPRTAKAQTMRAATVEPQFLQSSHIQPQAYKTSLSSFSIRSSRFLISSEKKFNVFSIFLSRIVTISMKCSERELKSCSPSLFFFFVLRPI